MRSLRLKLASSWSTLKSSKTTRTGKAPETEEQPQQQKSVIAKHNKPTRGALFLDPRECMEVDTAMLSFVKRLPLEELQTIGCEPFSCLPTGALMEHPNDTEREDLERKKSPASYQSRTITLGSENDGETDTITVQGSPYAEQNQTSWSNLSDETIRPTLSAGSGGSFESFMAFLENSSVEIAHGMTLEEFNALPDYSDVEDNSRYNEYFVNEPFPRPRTASSETVPQSWWKWW